MADPANRPVDWDMTLASLGTLRPINVLEIFTNIEIRVTASTMTAEASGDSGDNNASWDYPRIKDRDWTVSLSGRVEDPAVSGGEDHGLFDALWDEAEDSTLTFTLEGPLSGGNEVFSFTGSVKNSGGDLNFPGEAADQSVNLEGYGPPSLTLSSGTPATVPDTGA